jgi:hypothetical protein
MGTRTADSRRVGGSKTAVIDPNDLPDNPEDMRAYARTLGLRDVVQVLGWRLLLKGLLCGMTRGRFPRNFNLDGESWDRGGVLAAKHYFEKRA